jgi:hypothetical protein
LHTIAQRMILYILLAALAAQLAWAEVRFVTWRGPFTEWGFVQTMQSVFLAACMILLFRMARIHQQQASLAFLGALSMTILFIREQDQLLELFLPHGAWKWVVLPFALFLLWHGIRKRDELITQLRSLSATPAFGVYLAAGSTLVFSRLFGRKEFWEDNMSEGFIRQVKNAAEESLELFALGLFFAATVEWFLRERVTRDRQP